MQFEACEAFVRSRRFQGWVLLEERFDDEGYSGASAHRPALDRLLTLVRKRAVDRVVVHRLDRLYRSLVGCTKLLEEFRECGVGLVITTAPELGDAALDGLMLNVLASFAEFERELIATRIAESRVHLKARGQRIAGVLPFGYRADPRSKQLVPENDEAAVVKWMFDEAAAGKRPAEIAAVANAKGWPTKKYISRRTRQRRGGNPWTARQVLATLRNPVYSGFFRDKYGVRAGQYEAIVTRELFVAVAAQIDARRTRTPTKRRRPAGSVTRSTISIAV